MSADQDVDFWDYSFQEFSDYDLKACIEFIQKEKGDVDSKMTLIGYSEGTTTSFYALSEDPDYFEDKVNLFVALAPTINFKQMGEDNLRDLAKFESIFSILESQKYLEIEGKIDPDDDFQAMLQQDYIFVCYMQSEICQ